MAKMTAHHQHLNSSHYFKPPLQNPFLKGHSRHKQLWRIVFATAFIYFVATFMIGSFRDNLLLNQQQSLYAPTGKKYKGTPWRNDRTISVTTLGETKFARCDVHTVKSEDGKSQVNDWIFMEETDAVNVAVVTEDGNFVVFEQGKYAIPGITLSPVGGFVDNGEAPWESAKREVLEELGLGSKLTLKQMKNTMGHDSQRTLNVRDLDATRKLPRTVDSFNLADGGVVGDDDWIFLGRYRTAANRGGGFIYTYLLKNAVPILPKGGTISFRGSGDDESQTIKILTLSEVKKRTSNGDFQEVKWAATMSLAFMHLGH